jgi:hypothetical protein
MNLYRAFATVGGLTLLSRILGFVRDNPLRGDIRLRNGGRRI